jgi:hypothetical protein
VATTCVGGRAVVELLAHLGDDERELVWPVAVAESPDDRSVVFRTYCSQYPVDGRRTSGLRYSSPGLPGPETSSTATTPRYRLATPKRS